MKYKFILVLSVIILLFSWLAAEQDVSIYEIQFTTDSGSGTYPSPYEGQTVTITGIVTACNFYSSGSALRFFVSEPEGGAWKGVYIFQNTYEVEVGDEVTLTGEVSEYYGFTEISNLSSFSINSSSNPVPDPVLASTGDLTAPATGEQYEGCLTQVANIEIVQAPDNYGQWYVDDGSGNCQIDDGIYTYDDPTVGDQLASITGAVDYSFDEYGINPRAQSDFVTAGTDTIPPTLTNASAPTPQEVELVYSESVNDTTAEKLTNYDITNLSITGLDLQSDGKTILANTTLQTEGETYTITVNNVEDLAGNIIAPNSQIEFTGYQPETATQIADIQENFEDYDGEEVTVEGVVTIGDSLLDPDRTKFYIQDESGKGIQIFQYSPLPTIYKRGDTLEVTGNVTKYNSDVEIEDPEIILLGEDYPLPAPKDVTGAEAELWNGTWAKAVGEISDVWDASQYGFYQITVNVHGADIPLQFWNSTGADVSEYVVGDNVVAKGVISFYEGDLQLTCGYEEDIYKSGDFEYFKLEPTEPTPEDAVQVTFTYPETYTGATDSVYLKWHTMQQELFNTILMSQGATYNKFIGTIPAQPAGTMISFYTAILDISTGDSVLTNFPSSAPNNLETYGYSISKSKAILKVPPRTFCPALGERMEIQVISQKGDRVILRLYSGEGKLVRTFFDKNSQGPELVRWDGKDENYNVLDPGLYICHLEVVKQSSGEKKVDTAPIVIAVPLTN